MRLLAVAWDATHWRSGIVWVLPFYGEEISINPKDNSGDEKIYWIDPKDDFPRMRQKKKKKNAQTKAVDQNGTKKPVKHRDPILPPGYHMRETAPTSPEPVRELSSSELASKLFRERYPPNLSDLYTSETVSKILKERYPYDLPEPVRERPISDTASKLSRERSYPNLSEPVMEHAEQQGKASLPDDLEPVLLKISPSEPPPPPSPPSPVQITSCKDEAEYVDDFGGLAAGDEYMENIEQKINEVCMDYRWPADERLFLLWNHYVDLFVEFIQTYKRFPKHNEEYKGELLHHWLASQKKLYRRKKLSRIQMRKLNQALPGWTHDSYDWDNWKAAMVADVVARATPGSTSLTALPGLTFSEISTLLNAEITYCEALLTETQDKLKLIPFYKTDDEARAVIDKVVFAYCDKMYGTKAWLMRMVAEICGMDILAVLRQGCARYLNERLEKYSQSLKEEELTMIRILYENGGTDKHVTQAFRIDNQMARYWIVTMKRKLLEQGFTSYFLNPYPDN